MSQNSLTPELTRCIDDCKHCQTICLNMATGHCLEAGGPHIEPEHLRTMFVCAEVCGTAAYAMSTGSTLHQLVCAVCADICDACIESCQDLDGMEECIEACETCRNSCESMTPI